MESSGREAAQGNEAEPMTAEDFFNLGNESFGRGEFEDAIILLQQSAEIEPNDYLTWSLYGHSLSSLDRHEEAIVSYKKAMSLKPSEYGVLINAGVSMERLGRYEEAIKLYERAISIEPNEHTVWTNYGNCFKDIGYNKKAIESYDKALSLNPNDYKAWTNRGNCLDSLCSYEEAIDSYKKAISGIPNHYLAWSNCGGSLAALSRYRESLSYFDKAISLKPDYSLSWINRALSINALSTYNQSPSDLSSFIFRQSIPALNHSRPHIAALKEAFPHIPESTTDWGKLHLALGDAYLRHSRSRQNPSSSWRDAIRSYQIAYPLLTGSDHLSVLQGLVRSYFALNDVLTARKFQQEGQLIFDQLLIAQSEANKAAFFRKFVSFSQLEIDLLIIEQKPIAALEQAEFYKNRCLTWMLDGWQSEPESPLFADMQSLVSPTTAIVYWHLGLESLTTFLITQNASEPIVLPFNREKQSKQFKTWLGNYDSQYYSYADKKPKAIKKLEEHPWRQSLATQLSKLQTILRTDDIFNQLPEGIEYLILMPHRDLHRVPLHLFFPEELTCTFLPSLKIGLQNQTDQPSQSITPLLNVNDPKLDQDEMRFAQIESAVIRHITQDATTIQRSEASSENVFAELQKGYKTFHFTGHGAYNARKPSESSLGLVDSSLTAKQINQLDLSSYQLVCLAACETALTGKEGIPDEYVGLASAFLKAGATNVLSTLWPVDEIASAWIMIRFYQNLLAGSSLSTALKAAQQWLQTVSYLELADWITQLSNLSGLSPLMKDLLEARAKNTLKEGGTMGLDQPTDYQHPYYWAAFTLIGRG